MSSSIATGSGCSFFNGLESWDDAGDDAIAQTEFHNGDDGGILLRGGEASAHDVLRLLIIVDAGRRRRALLRDAERRTLIEWRLIHVEDLQTEIYEFPITRWLTS
jgi:hypothetical protein